MFFVIVLDFKDVDAYGAFLVRGIEIDNFITPALGYEVQKVFNQISVRVNEGYAASGS